MKNLLLALTAVFAVTTSFHTESHKTNDLAGKKPQPVLEKKFIKLNTENANSAEVMYSAIDFNNINKLNPEVFKKALQGFLKLKDAGKLPADSHILSIADFSLSSNVKRLWVIDLEAKKVLFNSLVAHGKNTGDEFATNFSNRPNSLQSSLGFYVTEGTYTGSNGYSLKLEGMDKGYNDAAMERAVVMHGADYVNENFAAQHKRIGRSWGCPAVPRELAQPIINTLKNQNCLFIYYPDTAYLNSSEWLRG